MPKRICWGSLLRKTWHQFLGDKFLTARIWKLFRGLDSRCCLGLFDSRRAIWGWLPVSHYKEFEVFADWTHNSCSFNLKFTNCSSLQYNFTAISSSVNVEHSVKCMSFKFFNVCTEGVTNIRILLALCMKKSFWLYLVLLRSSRFKGRIWHPILIKKLVENIENKLNALPWPSMP